MELINGNDLYKMFEYGTVFVVEKRKHLNDINVFPVPDGDTGNNLVHTLKTILRESDDNYSFIDTLDSISDSALIGARGNSGILFAQFINGLRKAAPDKKEIAIDEFVSMVEEGYVYTYNSLSNPVEGTILTLMREFGTVLKEFVEIGVTNLQELFAKTYKSVVEMLNKTTELLSVLAKNKVVDSGALGFVLFVKGISSYYNKEEINIQIYENVQLEDEHHFEGDVSFRYCTEGLYVRNKTDTRELKNELSLLGDSIVIADGRNLSRVHIHTNNPDQVFGLLNNYGKLENQKVDDMALEIKLKNSKSKRVLVIDSIADIALDILEENNVVVIPVNIDFDNVMYLDKLTINNQYIFQHLDDLEEYPKTATPTIKYISNLFSKLFLMFEEVIVVSVSKGLSATHDVIFKEASKLKEKGKKIHVIDSKSNSVSEGLIVKQAVDLINKGEETESIIKKLNIYADNSEILVCLNTFEYAMKSGRVPRVVGKIGNLIKMRPIMTLKEGKGSAFGFGFSQKAITKKIKAHIVNDMKDNEIKEYAIVHCENRELANEYKKIFTEIIGKEPEYISPISSAIALFSGLGSVAIGYLKEKRE
jgi:hypothetical protein